MKRLLTSVCLIACLFAATSCESSIADLSAAIRRGWEKLNGKESPESNSESVLTDGERERAAKLEAVPGTPLTDAEKIQVVDAQLFGEFVALKTENKAIHKQHIAEFEAKLTKEYPTHPPSSQEELEEFWVKPFPKQINGYRLTQKETYPTGETGPEMLFPNASFQPDPLYLVSVAKFTPSNNSKRPRSYFIIDRGYLGEWARTAYWYYLRKGFIDPVKSDRFKYLQTVERSGKIWVVWEVKKDKTKIWFSFLNNRYDVAIEGEEPDMLNEMVNTDFLEKD